MAQGRDDGSANSEWGGGGVGVDREVIHSFKYLLRPLECQILS